MTDPKHNYGEGADALKTELAAFEEACARHEGAVTEANADTVRDLIDRGVKLHKALEKARKDEKEPFLEAGREVDAAYKPLREAVEKLGKKLKAALTDYIKEVERKQREEAERARREAEEAARAAAEKAKDENPFEAFDAAEAEAKAKENADRAAQAAAARVQVGGHESARATSMRSYYSAEITDAAALVAHYAKRDDVIQAALKYANADIRNAKGQIEIPGVKVVEERRVA